MTVSRIFSLSLLLLAALLSPTLADQVGVPGSSTTYSSTIQATVGGKSVKMALTGTAMRTKIIINVYAIGSYVQEGVSVRTAEDLAAANCAKRLSLVMERDVTGESLSDAFRAAIRMNYAEPTYRDEVEALVKFVRSTSMRKGEEILLTHVPGVGLHCNVAGKADFTVRNPAFSKAVWDIYLGQRNLGDAIKRGLTSRL